MDDDWIEKRLAAALGAHPVSDAVVSVIKEQLKGPMRERPLKAAELVKISNSLLTQANPAVKESPQ
jgi:hypothetical protein